MSASSRPVILIPGFNGSLLVRKDRNKQINFFRKQQSEEEKRSAKVASHRPVTNDVVNFKLLWKLTSTQSIDPHKFTTFDFGGVRGVCDVVPQLKTMDEYFQSLFNLKQHVIDEHVNYSYFRTLVECLVDRHSYEPGRNIVGLPYDYRYIGYFDNRLTYYNDIKKRIEDTVITNNGSSIVVVAHSLGGMLFHDFLVNHVDEDWKTEHVHEFVTVNTPFGGVPQSLFVMFDKSNIIYETYRHFTGLHLCFPNSLAFSPTEPLVTVSFEDDRAKHEDKVITIEHLRDTVLTEYDDNHVRNLLDFWTALGEKTDVDTTHVVSSTQHAKDGIEDDDVVVHLTCVKKNDDAQESYVYGKTSGDGLVPRRSLVPPLTSCGAYSRGTVYFIEDTTHASVLKSSEFLKVVIEKLGCRSRSD